MWLDAGGYSSIVVEILEYVEKESDEAALQYHFEDLVDGTGDTTEILKQERAQMKTLPYVYFFSVSLVCCHVLDARARGKLFHSRTRTRI